MLERNGAADEPHSARSPESSDEAHVRVRPAEWKKQRRSIESAKASVSVVRARGRTPRKVLKIRQKWMARFHFPIVTPLTLGQRQVELIGLSQQLVVGELSRDLVTKVSVVSPASVEADRLSHQIRFSKLESAKVWR